MAEACRKEITKLWPPKPADSELPGATNAALIRDRYLRVPVKDTSSHPDARKGLLRTMQSAVDRSEKIYRAAYARYIKFSGNSQVTGLFTTKGRMILGLGNENVLETGLTLHHIYGTPMIPGTALKGLAAHYCDQVWGVKDERFKRGQEYHKAIFGTTDDAGHLIFHDAWITPETLTEALRPDVMTPHHGDYYAGKKNENKESGAVAPTDFDDPNPITFLSVSGTFHIAVSCDVPEEKQWTSFVFDLLADALREWGIGGKTSAGYGRLEMVRSGTEDTTGNSKTRDPALPLTPRYSKGQQIRTTRIEDPSGGGRPYFIADDGNGGFVEKGDRTTLPEKIGDSCDLVVVNYLPGDHRYSFAIPGSWSPYHLSNQGRDKK